MSRALDKINHRFRPRFGAGGYAAIRWQKLLGQQNRLHAHSRCGGSFWSIRYNRILLLARVCGNEGRVGVAGAGNALNLAG